MRLAVYVPDRGAYPYVLTAECLQPSLGCEHEYGQLQMVGTVTLDERVLPAIAHSESVEVDFEYVIYSGYGMALVESLLKRPAPDQGA